jgi:ABC-type transport system substrate-binding protein
MGGVAVPAGELLPNVMFGANKEMTAEKADVEGAKKLLAEAGYANGFFAHPRHARMTATSMTRRYRRPWRRCSRASA